MNQVIRFVDAYQIKDYLGKGAYGFVIKAFDKTIMQNVAIKVL